MEVFPLKFVTIDDLAVVGREIVDLAAIKRLGYPVPEGILIMAPEVPFTEVLRSYRTTQKEHFEQSITIIRSKFFAIAPPEELAHALTSYAIDPKKVWKDALTLWIEQIRSKVWRYDRIDETITQNLPPQTVFFIGREKSSGIAYLNSLNKKTVIEVTNGHIDEGESQKIVQLVEKLQKKILFSYRIGWVIDENSLYITKISLETGEDLTIKKGEKIEISSNPSPLPEKKQVKTVLKLVVNLSSGLVLPDGFDGIFLSSEKIETEDKKILHIVESAYATDEIVLFQLSDIRSQDDASSSLRLIHQPELLQKEVRNFLFAKHNYTKQTLTTDCISKQSMHHLQLVIPSVRSINELKQMKKLLKDFGFERRGNQQLWIDFSVPENWLRFDEYMKEGIDGLVVDIDQLYLGLLGLPFPQTMQFYSFDAQLVLVFLEKFGDAIGKNNLKVYFRGEHILDDEIVKLGVHFGISGLILTSSQINGAREYIARIEKHQIIDKKVEF